MFTEFLHKITKNKYYLIGVISIFLLLIITLGTAFLRSTLSINGTTKIKENSWIIYFDHVHDEQFTDNVTPEKRAIIVDDAKTRIEFTVDLKPGEVYEYTVDMINDGTVNASIESIDKYQLSDAQKKYLDFEVYYTEGLSAGLEPKVCDRLDAGTKREIKVSVRYKKGLNVEDYPSDDLHLDLFFDITYIQEVLSCPTEPRPYKLTLDPNGGTFEDYEGSDRKDNIEKYLKLNSSIYPASYELPSPSSDENNFIGWEVVSPGEGETKTFVLSDTPNQDGNYNFTIGSEDVYLRAKWKPGDYVARIQRKKFETIQAAFDAASDPQYASDNTVHLLRSTEEYPVNNTRTPFVFDLEAYTVTGRITNSANGNLTLVHGIVQEKLEDENDTNKGAVVNYGEFTLGQDDGVVDVENSVSLRGLEIGLLNDHENGSIFNFYDGYIEAERPIVMAYDGHPEWYYVFINHLSGTDRKRAYLVNNASRAVAKTETGGIVLYYDLQDAFDESAKNKKDYNLGDESYIIYGIRDFEGAYDLSVPEGDRVLFDTKGYKVTIGGNITNNGYLKIYNTSNNTGIFRPSKTIVNHGEMVINDLLVDTTATYVILSNDGALDISSTTVKGNNNYAITNSGTGTITFDEHTFIDAKEHNALFNSSPNLNITDGTIYGFINSANGATVSGGTFKVYQWRTYNSYSYTDHFIPAITNSGTLNVTGGNITETQWSTHVVQNKGTMNISGGTFDSIKQTFSNNYDSTNGTLNISGGNIHSRSTVAYSGKTYVTNDARITSDNGKAFDNGYLEVNNGTVEVTTGTVAYNTDVKITAGEIVTPEGTAIEGSKYQTVTVTGGTIHSLSGAAIVGTDVNVSGGLVEGTTYGIQSGVNVNVSSGKVTSDDKAITCSSINVSGGEITSPNDAITTKNVTVTDGKIDSTDGTAITLSGTGTILDGDIHGGMYGVLNNGKLVIGDDEGDISPSIPTIIGDSVGVYITGTDTYFFDGILKGQVDGYIGEITRTPLGGTPASGTETIGEELYQTDYIIQFEPWLEIEGVGQFNTIDAASSAIEDGGTGTIKVIKDVVPSFIQHFKDENHNKNITFDLNGHTLRSTQVAYNNESNVTVIDSVGTGKITNDICNYFENDRNMTINNIKIISTGDKAAIRNFRHGTLTITNANITAHNNGLQNMGQLIIDNITLTADLDAIQAEWIDELYDHAYGTVTLNNGTITAGKIGVNGRGTYIMNNGTLEAVDNGVYRSSARVNGGRLHSSGDVAIAGSATINGGEVISDTNYAVYTDGTIKVNGGYVEGTTALSHYAWYDLYSHPQYDPITITGGKVVGTSAYGVDLLGNTLTVTGGEVYGEVDGIKSKAHIVLGSTEDAISKTSPLIQGKRYGVKSTGTFYFFDGIIKGATAARDAQVNLVPDAAMVIDDYEFINRVEYKTEYLEAYGNWLRVGDQEFNSLYAAQAVIEDYGTVYVTKDVNINFEQSLVKDKHVTFDLNGHQVMMVKTLTTKGINTITDSSANHTGLLRNISEVEDLAAVTNTGNLTIKQGQYDSIRSYAIANDGGTMVIDYLTLVTEGCLTTYNGSVTINGGYFENTKDGMNALEVRGNTTINGGTFTSNFNRTINSDLWGRLTVNGGEIISTTGVALYAYDYNSGTTINGGTITGRTMGVQIENNKDSNPAFVMNGGHVISEVGPAIKSESRNTNIRGGTLEGATYGLDTTYHANIGLDDGNVSIDSPIIKGDLYGINIGDGATLNFYDGILKGISGSEQGLITAIALRTQVYTDTEVIDNNTYNTKYLIQEKDLAYNVEQDKYYNNLQDAFDDAGDNEHVELLTNIPIYYPVTNNTNHPFTLDLKGYTISTNKPIINNYNLTIIDSSNNGTIKASSNIVLLTNNGTMNLGDIKLINNGTSNYVLRNTGTMSITDTYIEGNNSLQNTNSLTINNANIKAKNNAIQSSGAISITDGTYFAEEGYALYNNGNIENTVTQADFTGNVYNYRNVLNINYCNIHLSKDYRNEQTVSNAGTLNIYRTNITGSGNTNNSGTMTITTSTIDVNSEKANSRRSGISNSGTLTVDNTKVYVDYHNPYQYASEPRGITNSGTANITNGSEIRVGFINSDGPSRTYYGILATGGTLNFNDSTLSVIGAQNGYGVYIDNSNATVVVETGNVTVNNGKYSYGAYVNSGTFTMGHYDEVDDESDLVSQSNPNIYAKGDIRGIGVKRRNGNFNFYDGIIWASTYAKPETTTHVEKFYEVTTYVDEATTLEYALLEFMGNDYDNTVVAKIGDRSFRSLQSAIDAENENNEEIILVRSVENDTPIEIPSGKNIVIDLHGMSLTTSINNNGTLQLYNGTVIEVGVDDPETPEVEDHNYINNYGTLIIGKDDGTVSSSNTRIISEGLAINNIFDDGYIHTEGRVEMYDGYIEGNPALNKSIDKIAEFARLYTKRETQYERIYLQSLSEDAIRNGETDLILTIDPNGGVVKELVDPYTERYVNHTEIYEVYLNYVNNNTYDLVPNPTKNACIFNGWEINDESVISEVVNGYRITIGLKDIDIQAKWIIDPNAVAKIGNNYYLSLDEALEEAKNGDVIELLKDITLEDNTNITVSKEVTLDLGGYTISGNIDNDAVVINRGILTIYNGTITNDINNEHGIGLINNKTLTMGVNNGEVLINDIKIFGKELGVEQNGAFNFYDGTIEGTVSILGDINSLPQGYYLYTNENELLGTTQLFLSGSPENAVAAINNGANSQLFFKLTNAITASRLNGKEIDIIKDFEAAYPITILEDDDITINMNSYNITTGNDIINNGILKLYDKSETKGSITVAKPVENNGVLTVEDITIKQNSNNNTLNNNSNLVLKNSTIQANNGYAVNNTGDIIMNSTSKILGNSYSLYNNNESLVLNAGEITGIRPVKNTELNNVVINNTNSSNGCIYINNKINLTLNNVSCTSNKYGIYMVDTSNANITVENSTILASERGLFVTGGANNNTITFTNVDINATRNGQYGIVMESNNSNHRNTLSVTGGTIKGTVIAAYLYYTNTTLSGATIQYNGNTSDSNHYALQIGGGTHTYKDNTFIKYVGRTDSYYYAAINQVSYTTLNLYDVEIESNASAIYSYSSNAINVYDGAKISGDNYGLSLRGYNSSSRPTVNINGGEITSKSTGIYMQGSVVNVNGGSVSGNTYGIRMQNDTNGNSGTLNIGKSTEELSIVTPYITGGSYGIYRETGSMYFYNGRLRGSTNGYNVDFNSIRTAHDIISVIEHVDETDSIRTLSTSNTSDEPVSKYAKINNGYAKITYIDETNGDCINNTVYDFPYLGDEEVFNVTCPGKYSLEVWGAQGGQYNSTYYGGYGGYSYGEINLNAGEVLYVNVGGAGSLRTGTSTSIPGGYNGGGSAAIRYSSTISTGSGGGATHIATSPGLLKELENNKQSILIVAGGGGGASYYGSNNAGNGGAGGGYKGNNGSSKQGTAVGTGGTQTEPGHMSNNANGGLGSFGQGANDNPSESTYFWAGGGGGYYGGGRGNQNANGAGGGSGYIGNSRLTNAEMYGYNVSATINDYVVNYLIVKEAFIQSDDGEMFNTINDGITYLQENYDGVGKLTFIKDVTISESSTIPANTEIELDLAGNEVKMTQAISNSGKLTISDSSLDHSGLLNNIKTNAITNTKNLVINNNVHIQATGSVISSNASNATIDVKDGSVLTGSNGIYMYDCSGTTLTISNATILGSTRGIYSTGGFNNNTITLTNVDINTTRNGQYGIVMESNNSNHRNTVNITGGTIKGTVIAAYLYYANTTLSGATIEYNGNTSDSSHYALQICGGTHTYKDNTFIKYVGWNSYYYAAAINQVSYTTLNLYDVEIESNASAIYSYSSNAINIYDGAKISGDNYGLSLRGYNSSSRPTVNINGGEITSKSTGIYMQGSVVNVNAGNVSGNTYGIRMQNDTNGNSGTLNIGKSTDELSTTTPYITGGSYGIYRETGSMYFYNGRLRGTEKGYNTDFNSIRPSMAITEIEEYEDPDDETSQKYIVDYLELLEPFIVAEDGQTFNSINDGVTYLQENYDGVGKLTFTRVLTYQQASTIPADTDIELDLAGFEIKMTQAITNNGKLTISDSSLDHSGLLNNIKTNAITNTKNLVINNNVHIQATGSVISSNASNSTIEVKDGSVITGPNGIYMHDCSGTTLTISNATILGSTRGIYTTGGFNNNTITLTNVDINTTRNGQYGIYMESNNSNHRNTLSVTGGTIKGTVVAASLYYTNTTLSGATIQYNGNTSDGSHYALQICGGTHTYKDNTLIKYVGYNGSYSAGAIYQVSYTTLNLYDVEIESNASAIYSYNSNAINIYEGAKIYGEKYGLSLRSYNTGSCPTVNINGGEITSKSTGIYMQGSVVNLNNGDIRADTYGIRMVLGNNSGQPTLNIGKSTDDLSTTVPYVEGSLYGVYKETGTVNFYGGRLAGNTGPYYGEINNIRVDHQIYLDNQEQTMNAQRLRTYSTTDYSATPIANTPKYGNGYAKITYLDSETTGIPTYTVIDEIKPTGYSYNSLINNYDYIDPNYYTYNVPYNGYYKLEVWGAQGGGRDQTTNTNYGYGGAGGYSSGIINLETTDNLYVYVGSRGKISDSGLAEGGFNGGGSTWGSNSSDPASGGGGASDIRINDTSLYSRVIVAGGGGGGGEDAEQGGYGGGLSGSGSFPGTQTSTSGGGVFGQGAHTSNDGGGAGGGWYGAGSNNGSQNMPTGNSTSDNNGGSGGSGYVFTSESEVVAGYLLDNKYQLTNAQLLAGNETFDRFNYDPDIYGHDKTKGNYGNGHARITYLGSKSTGYIITLTTSIGTLSESSLTYNAGDALGDLPIPSIPDNYLFDGWYLDQEYTKKVSYNTKIYNDATLYAKVITNQEYCSSEIKKEYTFDYKNGEETFTVPCSGEYKLEVWGASGGKSNITSQSGYGGYSIGKIQLSKNEKLYINVGGQGKYFSSATTGQIPGGYNGGGGSRNTSSNYYFGSAGGATHIAFKSGLLNTLSSDRDKIIIVAGGGGGYISQNTTNSNVGGSGGGYTGGTGTSSYRATAAGTGGNQEIGGYASNYGEYTRGTFGHGGDIPTSTRSFSSGGGGGYYGGGAGGDNDSSGGGGSGYTANERLYDKSMYGYNVPTKNNAETFTVAYLIPAEPYIRNKTQDITYHDLNLAFSQAHDNDEFELTNNGNNTINVTIPEITVSLDMKGFNINTVKPIVNNGNLTISNSETTRSKMYTNLSINLINNTGSLTISGVDLKGYNTIINTGTLNIIDSIITTSNQGIKNAYKMTISNSSVSGGSYALYDNSSEINTITNTTLSSSTSIQKEGVGRLNISSPTLKGTVNNTNSNSIVIIQGGTFNGTLSNTGTLEMTSMAISYYRDACDSYNQITNNGTMTLSSNTLNNSFNNSCSTTISTIINKSVLNSSTNIFTSYNNYYSDSGSNHNRYVYNRGIINQGILTSTSDTYNLSRTNSAIAIYNNSSSPATVNSITGSFTNSGTAYMLYNKTGTMNITGGNLEAYSNISNSYGIYTEAGTVLAKNLNITSRDTTNSYGIYSAAGTTTFETGNISATGTNAYGIRIASGTVTLGVEGNGVTTDNPYVEGVGTTTGYGVYVGDGSFNYYDGKILGSTNYRDKGFTNMEDGYIIQEITETNGKACILKSMY